MLQHFFLTLEDSATPSPPTKNTITQFHFLVNRKISKLPKFATCIKINWFIPIHNIQGKIRMDFFRA